MRSALRQWEARALARVEVAPTINATRPHPRFRYPDSPRTQSSEAALDLLRLYSSLYGVEGDFVLRGSARAAFEAHAGDRRGFRVGMLEPFAPDFLALARARACEIIAIPRDPDDWDSVDFASLDEAWLANPSPVDGFFYPASLYTRLAQRIAPHRHVRVLSDESTAIFSFNQEAPGSLSKLLGDERVTIASSIYPLMSPQGPEASWTFRRSDTAGGSVDVAGLDAEQLETTLGVARTFHSRQGASFGEFTRRMVALEHGFRLFADRLKPALSTHAIKVPHWPETGFFVRLNSPRLRERGGGEIEKACLELARQEGLLVAPGSLFDAPDDFLVCYAAPHPELEEMAARLLRFVL